MSALGVILIGIAAIPETYGESHEKIGKKIQNIELQITHLQNLPENINEITLSGNVFQFMQIKDSLLELNKMEDISLFPFKTNIDTLKKEYIKTLETHIDSIREHERESGLLIQEKKLVAKITKQKMNFEINESKQEEVKNKKLKIQDYLDRKGPEEKYQKLINEIAIRNAQQGQNRLDKDLHKEALQEIAKSKEWNLVIPAIERSLNQVHDEKLKEKLVKLKEKMQRMLELRKISAMQEGNEGGFGALLDDPIIKVLVDDILKEMKGYTLEEALGAPLEDSESIVEKSEETQIQPDDGDSPHASEYTRGMPETLGKPDIKVGKPDDPGKPDRTGPSNNEKNTNNSKSDNKKSVKTKSK
ncbi:hypothetical protein NKOR_03955 [Candidatus Nitrosopumilus koreensis AR1]|uniref:Uncharacterized protein n=1 Tax=Candidatus Nitrosopumilus koreensis AR1 TaxID=1229908 RepID=K0B874_9ARCH|nr:MULTISPECIES: hypothetical protein [Nitrosopumilus]AFS80681.1 hypothetical protein NKOR_03955 [Candidatus Nitrosopumilus koreensis AR1]